MELTFSEVKAFLECYNELKDMKLGFQTAYKLTKLHKTLSSEFEFYQNEFGKILETYAQKNNDGSYKTTSDGTGIQIREDMLDECSAKLRELESVKIQIESDVLTINDFDNLTVSPSMIESLMPFMA